MKRLSLSRLTLGYVGIIAAALLIAIVSGLTQIGTQIDDNVYDWIFRMNPPTAAPRHSAILAIDDETFSSMGEVGAYRAMLAKALTLLTPANPKVVAVDILLAGAWSDPAQDDHLENAMQATRNLVLATHLGDGGRWQSPIPRFRQWAKGIGHDRADEYSHDGITRQIPLEQRTQKERAWSLALEAFRLSKGERLIESPEDLQFGKELIPAPRRSPGGEHDRPLRVLYTRELPPIVSLKDLAEKPELSSIFAGKTVFIGVTAPSATHDRVSTPYGDGQIPGVIVHAELFETLAGGQFLTNATGTTMLAVCLGTAILAGLIFQLLSGWPAYLSAATLLIALHAIPFFAFRNGVVFPYFALLASGWLTVAAASVYQHFIVRAQLSASETERKRYQQAIQFVTHEMRTPLTAIQGSSELMGRYNLPEEKRKQIADMINQESKRLARMIQTFLDVERLSDGQMELKRESFSVETIIDSCLQRVRPLGERKNIGIHTEDIQGTLQGDRELMEYAVYNLMTNAVKYSGTGTEITVACRQTGDHLRLSVKDQGIGMDPVELRKIFQKFYRTKRAEASGEHGTGIGLSIVEQIVHHHGGKMEVTSQPGKGSCFTVVLPIYTRAVQPPAVSV